MSPFLWLVFFTVVALAIVTIAIGRVTGWRGPNWKPPHRRHVQDYQEGDENLSHEERTALAELEALNLHRRHPYC
ncbi:MAG: hypothetical protein O7A03_12990 [Alphaproteobacteria bacterium]|nr:hypothetical protein [Alphaproteobacteria bacterium]